MSTHPLRTPTRPRPPADLPLPATGSAHPASATGTAHPLPAADPAPRTTGLPHGTNTAPAVRRGTRIVLPVALALLAVPLVTAAHHARPAPYGDHLTVHARVDGENGAADPGLRTRGAAVEAYDTRSGAPRWTYTREGRRPATVLAAPGHAFALWSDGLVTDTARADGGSVRWHRAVPGGADWLRTPAARGGAGVLQPLTPDARMLAVVTPHRIAAYRTADGDLRWVLPARPGCAFEPARSVRRGDALMIAQPCAGPNTPWTAQVVAVDDYGRIVPGRTPLGNGDGERPFRGDSRPEN
ncbi:PQQ-like beta-propeller repeat protein [Streptomyces luteocolor]|uniref:PQQ-like beta-propeller repeat protein n=1 Tax=Streptomyces luteocolor TaxID=285500 RepID=UPI000B2A5547|nr:PQQ-like beta-propeller repeat protein [Streptomyces luteocolor]